MSVYQCVLFALMVIDGFASEVPPTKFEVTSLPGHTGKLPSKMFTGYINAGTPPSGKGVMYFHYWMVQSEGDYSKDPVIIWYNGGPGASSLFGLLQEFGPLLLTEDSFDEAYVKSGIPTPKLNPFRWSKSFTLVAIDSPPPMGMSFCSEEGAGGSPTSCGPWKDTTVFAANHAAHKAFFNDIFPELKPNPFFFAGESYAGIYVPGFVNAMLDDPISGLNFKGFMVGDGYVGCEPRTGKKVDWCANLDNVGLFKYPNTYPGPWYDLEFFHGHSQFSNELYNEIRHKCNEHMLRGKVALNSTCSALIQEVSDEVGYFYPYNLLNACPQAAADKHGMNRALGSRRAIYQAINGKTKHYSGLSSPCLGTAMPEWMNRSDTLAALGAPLDTNFINLDNGHGFDYSLDQPFVGPIYEKAIKAGLQVLVYEGDTDACGLETSPIEDIFVPLFAKTMKKTQRWRPWTTDGKTQMSGYVIEWMNGKVQFVSIRGSGHLSPLNRPEVTLVMTERFTSGGHMPILAKATQ